MPGEDAVSPFYPTALCHQSTSCPSRRKPSNLLLFTLLRWLLVHTWADQLVGGGDHMDGLAVIVVVAAAVCGCAVVLCGCSARVICIFSPL